VREKVKITDDRGRGWNDRSKGLSGVNAFDHLKAEMAGDGFDAAGWEVNVTGVPDGVLPIWEADRWWNGSSSMPLAEALKAGER